MWCSSSDQSSTACTASTNSLVSPPDPKNVPANGCPDVGCDGVLNGGDEGSYFDI